MATIRPGERDPGAGEAAWVAAAVEPLVMGGGDLGGEFEERQASAGTASAIPSLPMSCIAIAKEALRRDR